MKRTMTAILGLSVASWFTLAQADSTVLAVRLGANDVAALAKFYQATFGLKEIDHVGEPATEIIMRFGATVAAAKAGSSPEFLVAKREGGATDDQIAHAAKAAGATMRGDVASVPIGGTPIKIATMLDPDGNVLEVMELPKGLDHLPH